VLRGWKAPNPHAIYLSCTPTCLPSIMFTVLWNHLASSSVVFLQDILDELRPSSWSRSPPLVCTLRQTKSIHIYLFLMTHFSVFIPLTLYSQSGQFPANFRIDFWRPHLFMSLSCVLHAKPISSSLIRYLVSSISCCLFSLDS